MSSIYDAYVCRNAVRLSARPGLCINRDRNGAVGAMLSRKCSLFLSIIEANVPQIGLFLGRHMSSSILVYLRGRTQANRCREHAFITSLARPLEQVVGGGHHWGLLDALSCSTSERSVDCSEPEACAWFGYAPFDLT